MSQGKSRYFADQAGIWASAACVVHCILTPVLLSASAIFVHIHSSDERVYGSMAVANAGLGAMALLQGYRQQGKLRVIGLMLCGFACIASGAFFGDFYPATYGR